MKEFILYRKVICILLASSVLLASCSSTTLIQSTPIGAKVYVDDQPVGTTPYSYSDTKIVTSTTRIKLEKDGYEPLSTFFSRDEQPDVGAIIAGVFLFVPFLWTMKYNPVHSYELKPLVVERDVKTEQIKVVKSKAERLRELKQLLDEKLITQEDYEREKKKILDELE